MTPAPQPSASPLLNTARRPLPGVACMNRSYPAGYGQRYTEAAHVDLELVESPVGSLQALPLVQYCPLVGEERLSSPGNLETSRPVSRPREGRCRLASGGR